MQIIIIIIIIRIRKKNRKLKKNKFHLLINECYNCWSVGMSRSTTTAQFVGIWSCPIKSLLSILRKSHWDVRHTNIVCLDDEWWETLLLQTTTMASPMETQQGQEHRDDNTGATKGSPPHKAAMQTNIPQNVCNMSHAVLASVAFHWPDEVNQSKLREWTQLILAGSELLSATAKHSHLTVALGYERQQPTPQYV